MSSSDKPRTRPDRRPDARQGARLDFPGTGVTVPVPAGDDPKGEVRALDDACAADPAFRAMADEIRRDRVAGRSVPAADLYRELGYTPPAPAEQDGEAALAREPVTPT